MMKRLNNELAKSGLLSHANNNKHYCKGRCLKMLWRGKHDILAKHNKNVEDANINNDFGKNFLEVGISAKEKSYHTSSYKSSIELKALL
jgi:hypothetical protein